MYFYPQKIAETKLITRDVSIIIFWAGIMFLIPMLVALIYSEPSWWVYPLLTLVTSGPAYLFMKFLKEKEKPFMRMTIITLATVWILACLGGSLPFIAVGGLDPLDGVFESVSSISTAGLTNLRGVEFIPHSVLFWRAMMAWFGGIGITAMAFYAIMQSESMSKLVLGEGFDRLKPNIVNSAKEIFKIYSFWTVLGLILLILIGTPVFDSFSISMNAISTTGVDVHDEGWGYYQRTMPETFGMMTAIVALLMIVGAISFVAHYRVIKNRKLRLYFQDTETKFYLAILVAGILLVSTYLILHNQNPAPMAYEALSTSTTGGFEIQPYMSAEGGNFIIAILAILALIGGSTNSAAGGLKAKRVYLVLKYMVWRVGQQISPRGTVSHLKYEDRVVDQKEIANVATYLFIYGAALILVITIMVGFDYDPAKSILTVTSAQSGGGVSAIPGWELVPPVKVALIFTMLFGRLEFIPLFALGLYAIRRR
jgi:trk system potassium uptake protein TrkH